VLLLSMEEWSGGFGLPMGPSPRLSLLLPSPFACGRPACGSSDAQLGKLRQWSRVLLGPKRGLTSTKALWWITQGPTGSGWVASEGLEGRA
jgi:hypothetical protein